MRERDYLRKRQELQSDYKKKIEALETVWKLFNADVPLPYDADIDDDVGSSLGWTFEISKKRAVRQACVLLEGDFATDDVRTALKTMNPAWSNGISDIQLGSIVAKLAAAGELEITRSKVGRSSAIYKNKEPSQTNATEEGDMISDT